MQHPHQQAAEEKYWARHYQEFRERVENAALAVYGEASEGILLPEQQQLLVASRSLGNAYRKLSDKEVRKIMVHLEGALHEQFPPARHVKIKVGLAVLATALFAGAGGWYAHDLSERPDMKARVAEFFHLTPQDNKAAATKPATMKPETQTAGQPAPVHDHHDLSL